jgi:hypothetical protein
MRALDAIQELIAKAASQLARRRQGADFVCGECERWQRCGLPPSNRCIVMAAQIASGERRSSKPPYLANG